MKRPFLPLVIMTVLFAAGIAVSLAAPSLRSGFLFAGSGTAVDISTPPDAGSYDYGREQARLRTILKERGSAEAYAFFQTTYQNYDPAKIHNLAHWIGSEIYAREGVKGIALCDSSFQFGCYHGFLGTALSREGKSLLPKVEDACASLAGDPARFGGCVHGIGHGVLGLQGYDHEHLVGALGDCESLSSSATQEGCYNGVFMEYNVRTMQGLSGETTTIRSYSQEKAFEPCGDLPDRYQKPCFYEQPAWWKASQIDLTTAGTLCATVKNAKNQGTCFEGLGRLLLSETRSNRKKIGDFCAGLATASGQSYCIGEAIRLLLIEGDTQALELCTILSGANRRNCTNNAQQFLCNTFSRCRESEQL